MLYALLAIGILTLFSYYRRQFITMSYLQLFLGFIFFCGISYGLGKMIGSNSTEDDLQYKLRKKEEVIDELNEEIKFLKEKL